MSTASNPEPTPPRGSKLAWDLDKRWTALALFVLLWLEVWAWVSTDPDYYLPDLFRPLAIAILIVVLLSGLMPWPRVRTGLRGVTLFIIASGLLLEFYTAVKPAEEDDRITLSDDVLLRYHYTPNVVIGAGGFDSTVNQFGAWDDEYSIPKPDDVYRVVVLGGSMGNDGHIAFHDRYHAQLEQLLVDAHPAGKTIEIINVSCEGYNTFQQVRLFEQIGVQYDPDLVIVAYQLSDPFLQDGSGRRVGNSQFLFRFLLPVNAIVSGSRCGVFSPLYDNYGYQVMVRSPLERLNLLGQLHGFESMVAVMPVVEEFDDPTCADLYDQVMATAAAAGLEGIRVPDAFIGDPAEDYRKPEAPGDLSHPNVAGHTLIAETLAAVIKARLEAEPAPASARAPVVPARAIPSCAVGKPGAGRSCGTDGTDDCCASAVVPGGSFIRSHDGIQCKNPEYPATVGDFELDVHEVTVGRFRAFLDAGQGTQSAPPDPGAGTHPKLPDSGWSPAWNDELAESRAALERELACAPGASWTSKPGANETLPINCLTFYEAAAFCAWDGGFLPTEAERDYVASGGDEQRVFPWSTPPDSMQISPDHAVYAVLGTAPVGTHRDGDGRWGHADLAGNVWEWTLDEVELAKVLPTEGAEFCAPSGMPVPCNDCAATGVGTARVLRGGGWGLPERGLSVAIRRGGEPDERHHVFGVRCARPLAPTSPAASAGAVVDYPAGPFGLAPGEIFPNVRVSAISDATRNPDAMTELAVADYYEPDAEPSPLLAVYFTTAWAEVDRSVALASWARAQHEAQHDPAVDVVVVMLEGERRGQPADAGNLRHFAQTRGLAVPVAMDDKNALAAVLDGDTAAQIVLVDRRSMKVLSVTDPADGTAWSEFLTR